MKKILSSAEGRTPVIIIVGFVLIGFLCSLLGVYLYIVTDTHRRYRFNVLTSLVKRSGFNTRVVLKNAGEIPITLESDGFELVADLYTPNSSPPFPAIVFVHSSHRFGRNEPLYKLFSRKFRDKGYVVLAPDLRGFGDSEDPVVDTVEIWDSTNDVIAAVDYLLAQDNVNPSEIYTVGHAWGSNFALSAGLKDQRIKKAALVGPPRRTFTLLEKQKERFTKRFSRNRKLERILPYSLYKQIVNRVVIDHYLPALTFKGHIPVMLVEEEFADQADKDFLKEYYNTMVPPKFFYQQKNIGYYFNTMGMRLFIVYDGRSIGETVNAIDRWLQGG